LPLLLKRPELSASFLASHDDTHSRSIDEHNGVPPEARASAGDIGQTAPEPSNALNLTDAVASSIVDGEGWQLPWDVRNDQNEHDVDGGCSGWVQAPSLHSRRCSFAAATLNGVVYVVGGHNGNGIHVFSRALYACAHAHARARTHASTDAHTDAHIHARANTRARTCTCTHARTHATHTHVSARVSEKRACCKMFTLKLVRRRARRKYCA
jgi:hypothetical protein